LVRGLRPTAGMGATAVALEEALLVRRLLLRAITGLVVRAVEAPAAAWRAAVGAAEPHCLATKEDTKAAEKMTEGRAGQT